MRRGKLFVLAALVSLALAGLWRWQADRRAERQAHKEAWIQYLQGPLADLLYGSSRMRPLIVKKRLSPADQAEAVEAVDRLRDSYKRAAYFSVLFTGDAQMHPLVQAEEWHHQIFSLYEPWKSLQGKPLAKEALVADGELRQALWNCVNAQRDLILKEQSLTKDETLEMNALLYSLHEKEDAKP
jgi:hypothetical protein